MEPFKPLFIMIMVLLVAGLIFLALRLEKGGQATPKDQFINWKRIY